MVARKLFRLVRGVLAVAGCAAVPVWALQPRTPETPLEEREFVRPELSWPTATLPLESTLETLANRADWENWARRAGSTGPAGVGPAFLDARSLTAAGLLWTRPLLPGSGVGNRVSLRDLSAALGRPIDSVSAEVVAEMARQLTLAEHGVLGIEPSELGTARAMAVAPELWQVHIPQTYRGLPVRHAHLALAIKHGNLVLLGTESWGRIEGLSAQPRIKAEEALEIGFAHAGGRSLADVLERQPALEVLPVEPAAGADWVPGKGYAHRLTWSFVFRRAPEPARWEALVDAHSGELLAFQDLNQHAKRTIKGAVFPITNTEVCPTAEHCGVAQSSWPMPFSDTGFAFPEDFANSGGVYNYTAGVATTTLSGRYVDITDGCGTISLSSATGNIDLGGGNSHHDCATPGVGGPGNTPAARSAYYHVNKIAEIARGYLPGNAWLQAALTVNTNLSITCGAFWSGTAVNLGRGGSGCRNVGEIAGALLHEWGHGLDDNDANGVLSNSTEGYADIAAVLRTQSSCVGYGVFQTTNPGCGMTADGTGFNCSEQGNCCLDCSGVREADYAKHANPTPFTPQNHVCALCPTGTGPCGRQVHCASAPARQAAWDLAARDLQAPPFGYDSQTAFIVANKLFYQGSGNIGTWHNCNCAAGTSDGCGATNAYLQWLVADDDNGNLADGTPHMSAVFAAFDRHRIACAAPAPVNSGCAGGPHTAPVLSAAPGVYSAALNWTAVPGAARYWVFRTEGHAGCHFGKALIAEVNGTSYVDTQVAACRRYWYNVVAAGASSACYSRASNCAVVLPKPEPPARCAVAGVADDRHQ